MSLLYKLQVNSASPLPLRYSVSGLCGLCVLLTNSIKEVPLLCESDDVFRNYKSCSTTDSFMKTN